MVGILLSMYDFTLSRASSKLFFSLSRSSWLRVPAIVSLAKPSAWLSDPTAAACSPVYKIEYFLNPIIYTNFSKDLTMTATQRTKTNNPINCFIFEIWILLTISIRQKLCETDEVFDLCERLNRTCLTYCIQHKKAHYQIHLLWPKVWYRT